MHKNFTTYFVVLFVLFLHIAMEARNFCRITRNFWCMTFFLSLLFNCAQMTTDDSNRTSVTEASDEKLRMPLEVERHSDPLVSEASAPSQQITSWKCFVEFQKRKPFITFKTQSGQNCMKGHLLTPVE